MDEEGSRKRACTFFFQIMYTKFLIYLVPLYPLFAKLKYSTENSGTVLYFFVVLYVQRVIFISKCANACAKLRPLVTGHDGAGGNHQRDILHTPRNHVFWRGRSAKDRFLSATQEQIRITHTRTHTRRGGHRRRNTPPSSTLLEHNILSLC